ncbi:MAG: hypothetical protein WEE89_18065 [Gemmatimonadota bacterium]
MLRRMTCTLLLLAGCNWDDGVEPALPPVVQLAVPPDVQVSDTTSRVSVRVSASGEFNPRVAVLRVTGGEFFPGGTNTIVLPLDAEGNAAAALRPPLQPGWVILTATAGATTVRDSIRFSATILPPLIDSLSLSHTAAPADEASQTRVSVQLSERGRRNVRAVTFNTTAGLFTNRTSSISADVDANGVASAILIAPAAPTRADVTVTAAGETARREIVFQQAPPSLRSISFSTRDVSADNATPVIISVQRDPSAIHIDSVIIEVSEGKFLPGTSSFDTARFDGAGQAIAVYQPGRRPGVVIVRAMRGQQTLVDSLRLTAALPNALTLTGPSETVATANQTLTFTATATRNIGEPSRGTPVEFEARTDGNAAIGTFLTLTPLNDTGGATSTFVLNNPAFAGNVIVTARVPSATGDTLTATHILRVR